STGWGSPHQIRDPTYATKQFLQHLVQLPNWQSLPVGQAVQRVQRSADTPGQAYQRWVDDARQLASNFHAAEPTPAAQLKKCRSSTGQPSPSQVTALTTAVQGPPGTIKVLGTVVTPLFNYVPPNGYPDTFPAGQCTYYAAWQNRVTWSGNAADWYGNARAQGAHVTNAPTIGAIAVWRAGLSYGVYGHVGIVMAMSPNSYTVAEMNYLGEGVVDQRVVAWPDSDIEGFIL
ncbi:MAG: CHAP domain-containing protein, partial [Candidatus Dormibacteraeota bacterium]|nr:CHAP domain-containing protein [Candidatus Dormibacteraeota bacterium]